SPLISCRASVSDADGGPEISWRFTETPYKLPQKPREILFFPAPRASIPRKLAFPLVTLFGVDPAPSVGARFVRHHRVQHFVIENVTEEPWRNERLIEQRVDPDHAILFLDRPENKIILRPPLPFPAPNHLVSAQASTKKSFVQPLEIFSQIETLSFVLQVELPL